MLTYRPFHAARDLKAQAIYTAIPDAAPIKYHTARLDFVSSLFAIPQTNNLQQSAKALAALKGRLTSTSTLAEQNDAQTLGKDISGEGLLALMANNFSRWGKHYLLSLPRARQRQQSGNFKDPGTPSIAMYYNNAPQGGHAGTKKRKGGFG
jgi:VWA / Hh  protein intein-like